MRKSVSMSREVAGLVHGGDDLIRLFLEHAIVRAAQVELDGEAAPGDEIVRSEVLRHGDDIGDLVELGPELIHERELADGALGLRLERDVNERAVDLAVGDRAVGGACVAGEATNGREEVIDLGMLVENLFGGDEFVLSEANRGTDRRLETDEESALVLAREEFLGKQIGGGEREEENRDGDEDDEPAVIEAEGEDATIALADSVELRGGPVGVTAALVAHELRTAHGRDGDGLDEREEDGSGDRDPELEEEAADDSAHERDGKEDGDDGDGGGNGGEGDFARAVAGSEDAAFAHLAVADDIFEHHDRVIDDDADGERETEQRKEIEREAHEVEDRKRAHDRRGNGQENVDSGADRAEEEEADNAGDEGREDKRELGLVDGVLNEGRCCRS